MMNASGARNAWLTLLVVLFGTGCAATRPVYRPPMTGNALADGLTAIQEAPVEDRVVWQLKTAAIAMRESRFEQAKRILDDALLTIEGRYGPSESARKSRSVFRSESDKVFIGDPYERAMAYFYRGIIYWMDGEPDNARAAFRSAQFQDGDAEEGTYQGDYVLFDYLDGYLTALLGGDGSDLRKRAIENAEHTAPPPFQLSANVFVFGEMGSGPKKRAGGQYGERLYYTVGNSTAKSLRVAVTSGSGSGSGSASQSWSQGPLDSISFQARTRGGRVMDHVLGKKAVYKGGSEAFGDAAIISGAILAQQKKTREAGAGLLAAGVLAHLLAEGMTPEADTRGWDNLPEFITFIPLTLPAGPHELLFEFLDGSGNPIDRFAKKATIQVPPAGPDIAIFVTDR